MATIRSNGNWVHFNSHENKCFEHEDNEEETLSLCDLPTNDNNIQHEATNLNNQDNEQEDFQFGSCHVSSMFQSPEKMCDADEVFFQGQLLPLRHSVSSDNTTGLILNKNNIINRSASFSYNYKPKIRNQFHSHPSPSPQIRTQSFRTLSHSNPKGASLWSFLQVGLVKPQEIGLSDLKNRSKRFGSHNSNSSSNSSGTINSTNENQNQNRNQNKNKTKNFGKKTKKKQRLFFGGCKCSAVSIDGTIKETVTKNKKTTKEESTMMIGDGKHAVSRHRTFEWLKQLSIVEG